MSPSAGPMRYVVRWSSPDPRHRFYVDLVMNCGHTLAHRPLRRGPDGRFHVPKRQRCPVCTARGCDQPANPPILRTQPTTQTASTSSNTQASAPASRSITTTMFAMPWSAKDLAARNWD